MSASHPLILASTSPYRRAQLERLGVPFQAATPTYEEEADPSIDPGALARRHAEGKARSVAGRFAGSVIIGSDQLVSLDGAVLGKPGTPEAAAEQLRAMRGREHTLLTAVTTLDVATGRCLTDLEQTRLRMRALTDDELTAYVRADDPVDCAGSYKIEGLGIALFEYARGDDPSAIMGLPMIALVRQLAEAGINVLGDPWSSRPSR